MPKASFLAPVYNGEVYIAETIRSMLDQTLKDIEIIFINDGSTDGTEHILKHFENQDDRFRYYNMKKNVGISKALNYGTKKVTSPIIMISSSDDVYAANRARLSYTALKSGKYDAFYGSYLRSGENIYAIQTGCLADGSEAAIYRAVPYTKGCLDAKQVIPHGFMSITKAIALATPYREDLLVGVDYPFLKDLEANGCKFKWTQKVLGVYRMHPKQVSRLRREEVNRATDVAGGTHE